MDYVVQKMKVGGAKAIISAEWPF